MFERIRQMFVKELRQSFRNREMWGILFIVPFIELFIFTFALASDVSSVATAVLDLDQTPMSREFIAGFTGSRYFRVVERPCHEGEVRQILDQGKALLVLQINRGFGAAISAGKTASVQALLDGTDSNTASIVMAYASRIITDFNQNILVSRLERQTGRSAQKGGLRLETRAWFNPNLEKLWYFVPGIMATLITLTSLQLTAMAIVREKEIGTMEQIMVTPITPWEFILGKTLPFFLYCLIEVVLVTLFAWYWFRLPLNGSWWVLLAGSALYLLTSLGIGLFISSISQTQQQAMMTQFFYFQPVVMLSGFAFPIANMPGPIQVISLFNPLRYFLVIIRSVFLKGSGFSILWPQFLPLGLMGISFFWLASRRFQKTLN